MHPNPEILALLALGEDSAATGDEHRHITGCPVCSHEVAELAHLAGVGRSTSGSGELLQPAAHVWERIRAEISANPATSAPSGSAETRTPVETSRSADPSPQTLPETDPEALPAARTTTSRRRGILAIALAAVLALVVGTGIGIGIGRLRQPDVTVLAEGRLSALPAWSGSSGTATLERDADGNRILVVKINATKPLDGVQQVWLVDPADPTKMRSVGLLNRVDGRWPIPANIDVNRYSLVDVSEEPPDDPSVAHSGNSIVRGPLVP